MNIVGQKQEMIKSGKVMKLPLGQTIYNKLKSYSDITNICC